MNITKKLALTAMLATTLAAGAVQAAEPGFYLGGAVGQARLDADAKDFGYSGEDARFTVKDDDTAWKGFIGYNWSVLSWLNVGLEGGYKDFGNFRQETRNGTVRSDPTGWDAFLVGSIPVGPVDLFAKVGGIALNRDINTPQFGQDDDDDNQLAYGVGVAYNVGHLGFRVEAEGFDDNEVDDFYMISAGVTYHFFSPKPAVVAAAPVAVPVECPDTDGDGVCDSDDQCPNTPANTAVDAIGCTCHYSLNLEFAFDSAELSVNDMVQLDAIVPILTNPKAKFIGGTIDGHTDSIGSEAYNMGLSQRRADAVKAYLESKGANLAGRFTATGFGESKPVASNDTEEGRAQNRRVELHRTDCDHSK
jgi:outer membrane protein OmpA-like peptidoglycan-associated protein